MGIIQKDAFRTTILSYIGLILGYLNKGVFFVWFLSIDQIGLVNLVVALGLLFAQLSNLGTINAIWKFFPFFKDSTAGNHGFLRYILSIVAIGILFFTLISVLFKGAIQSFYIEKSAIFIQYYFWLIPIGITQVLFFTFEAYLKSLYKNVFPILINEIIYRFLVLLALLAFGFKWINFSEFIIVYFLLFFFPFIALLFYTKWIGELYLKKSQINIKKNFRKLILNYSGFNYLNTTGAMFVMSIDTLMIGSMLGLEATGIYTTIMYLTNALSIPYRSITRISMPIVSEFWKDKAVNRLRQLYQQVSSVSLFLGIILFMLVWINRTELFRLLPKEFVSGISVFLFLMIGRLFDFFGGINGQIFLSSKRYKNDVFFTLFLLLTVAVLNYYLIPLYGITGAAISTGIALSSYNIGRMIYVYTAFGLHPLERSQVKILALFVVNILFFELFLEFENYGVLGVMIKSVLFISTFVVPVYVLKIEPNSINYLNGILRKLGLKS